MNRTAMILAAAFAAALCGNARATLLSEETFDYAVEDNIDGHGGGTGWNGAWSVGVPYQGYMNQVRYNADLEFAYAGFDSSTTPALSRGAYLNLAAGWGSSTFNYAQRTVDLTDGGPYDAAGLRKRSDYGFWVAGADGATLWGGFLIETTAGATQLWLQQMTSSSSAASTEIPLPNFGSASVPGLVVFCIQYAVGDDTMRLWYNPDLAHWAPDKVPPDATLQRDCAFSNFIIVENGQDVEVRVDDIRLGTEPTDVIPCHIHPRGTVLSIF